MAGIASFFDSPHGMDPSSLYNGVYSAPTPAPSNRPIEGLTSVPVKTVKVDAFGNPILPKAAPTPTMSVSAAPAPAVPHASGTLDYFKDQTRLPSGNPMQANPALDAIGAATNPLAMLFGANWGGVPPPGLVASPAPIAALAPPVDAGLVTPADDPWAGMVIGSTTPPHPPSHARAAAPKTSPVAQMFGSDLYPYINAPNDAAAAAIHAANMKRQTDGVRTDQNGKPVIAMNGKPARSSPNIDQFGMIH